MKKLIVTGGGFAGAKISRRLENYFEVTLIDEKEYFEFTPGILRSITNPKHLKKIQINHKDYLKKSKFVLGKVSKIWEDYIFVNKEGIKYDYLVICSGSRYESPIKDRDIVIASRGRNLAKYTNKLSKAKNIIIIGGGLVGIELAGEILSRYNNKNIRIIHSNERIIYRNNIKSCIYAERFLKKNNVSDSDAKKIVRSVANIPIGAQASLPNFGKRPKKGDLFKEKTDLWPIDPIEFTTESPNKTGVPEGGPNWL